MGGLKKPICRGELLEKCMGGGGGGLDSLQI